MKLKEVMAELKALGSAQIVRIYRKHGADGEMFGVKIGDLKKILRKVKGDQELAMKLWETGNSDAMYLAALVADGRRMTKKQLNSWSKTAWWYMLSEHAVPFVAAEHDAALAIGSKWMKSKQSHVATSGWATYTSAMSILPDSQLDLNEIKELLELVEAKMESAPNRVRYCMNSFVIGVGAFVKPLLRPAKATAQRIGKVEVNVGNTSCKVPLATEAIKKIESMGRVGKKRTSAKC